MNEDRIRAKYPANRYQPVLISEVTRMNSGYHCVAGWDIHGQRMVRPLPLLGSNWRLGTDRTVFSVGHLINCIPSGIQNNVLPHGKEDFPLSKTPTLLEKYEEPEIYAFLLDKAFRSISELFGCRLVDNKYIPENSNCCSLGGVRILRRRTRFNMDSFGTPRLDMRDNNNVLYHLPITSDDLHRMYCADDKKRSSFNTEEAERWLCSITAESEIILRIGLARGWAGRDGDWNPLRCYIQLNGIICPTGESRLIRKHEQGPSIEFDDDVPF